MIAGGGAAGFFAAIACTEGNPDARVTVCELTGHPLAKVRISGGGRCNVTTALTQPQELVRNYPRGGRELLGPFHRWGPRETVAWFAARGVELRAEADGRMFPVTDDAATVVDCLQRAAAAAGVTVRTRCGVQSVRPGFEAGLTTGETVHCDRLLIATGGGKAGGGIELARGLGHTIEPPVPSLFTFQLADPRLTGLAGVAVEDAEVRVPGTRLRQRGPLLITHWGMSGPAILKLSAWGARVLHDRGYRFKLTVNWMAPRTRNRFSPNWSACVRSIRGGGWPATIRSVCRNGSGSAWPRRRASSRRWSGPPPRTRCCRRSPASSAARILGHRQEPVQG